MNTFKKLVLSLALVAFATAAFGQLTTTQTTLSAAVTGGTSGAGSVVQLTSATGVVTPGFNVPNQPTGNATVLFVDKEAMYVTSVSGTNVSVLRGWAGTISYPHNSGAVVYVAAPANFTDNEKYGACVSTALPTLPLINTSNGHVFTCLSSGEWIMTQNGTMNAAGSRISAFCTGTVGSAETAYLNGAACSAATTATARQVITTYGVIGNLRVFSSANFLGTGSTATTVFKNGSATTITCSAAAATVLCSDLTHSVAVVPGDVITFQNISATSDTAANIAAAVGLY